MNRLDREFNLTERILLLLLGILLTAGAYYRFVFAPTAQELSAARAQRDALEMELSDVQLQIAQLTRIKEELNDLDYSTQSTRMASYNDSENELALLNSVLQNTDEYSIAFKDVTRSGDMVRRSFTMQFTAKDIETVDMVLMRLTNGGRRCMIGDVSCSVNRRDGDTVNVLLVATFYETMVGGTPDPGLPEAVTSGS